MRMKDFVINIGNIEKGIKKVFKESLYKCDELDRASINGVITALYLQKPLSLVVIHTECNKVIFLISSSIILFSINSTSSPAPTNTKCAS